nr:MAG TPA: Reovirus sigma C capsid protein [Caudoviricetes sp.]
MAVIFPESMNRLDLDDPSSSLSTVENYIRYMTERMEFSNKNLSRTVNSAGVSTVEIIQLLVELSNAISTLQSTVSGLQGTVTGLNTRVGALETSVTNLNSAMTTAQNQIGALDDRVTALENESGGTT